MKLSGEEGEWGMKLVLKKSAQIRTRAATRTADILANTTSGNIEDDIFIF